MCIYKEHYTNFVSYISRWWAFYRFFNQKKYQDDDWLRAFMNFRKELRDYTFKFGRSKMYYLDDQSIVLKEVGEGSKWEMSWNDFENFVYKKTSHLMLDNPKFMTDEKYRSDFQKLDEYPLIFIDDFKDIKEQ